MNPKKLVIASRESLLAMWQAKHIQGRLKTLYPDCEVEILGMTTRGDQILDKTLSKIGGKGLFIKELEQALQDGRADLAVHSIKDVPMDLPEDFALAAIGERANPFDAFVSNQYARLEEMPKGAVVGTSSLRREAQLRARYPHLVIKPLRGNVQTRLSKLDNGEYDAIILAAAGLQRLELDERIRLILSEADSLPAAGQGALGIEIAAHRSELLPLLAPLNHAQTALKPRHNTRLRDCRTRPCPRFGRKLPSAACRVLHRRKRPAHPARTGRTPRRLGNLAGRRASPRRLRRRARTRGRQKAGGRRRARID